MAIDAADKGTLVTRLIWDFEDIVDTWDQANEEFKEAVVSRMTELGMDNQGFKKFKFAEFNIKDMYKVQGGDVCYFCANNLLCKKHELTKQNTLYKEEHFEKAELEDYKLRHKDFIEEKQKKTVKKQSPMKPPSLARR